MVPVKVQEYHEKHGNTAENPSVVVVLSRGLPSHVFSCVGFSLVFRRRIMEHTTHPQQLAFLPKNKLLIGE
jgi:hypothetical protein